QTSALNSIPQNGKDMEGQTFVCPYCERDVSADDAFCRHCGAKLLEEMLLCPNCEETIPLDSIFCPKCGARLKS
ncbi:MAG: zinc ribbon domain-containing protein, partial [Candidatus Thermoplasmatota archaeon]|nr:zinc ribbon domain-containing protein [Candidatus Thermoplasmatota archaeon]